MSARARVRVTKKKIPLSTMPAGGLSGFLPGVSGVGESLNECLFDRDLAFRKCAKMLHTCEQFAQVVHTAIDARIWPSVSAPDGQFARERDKINAFTRESCRAIYGTDEVPSNALTGECALSSLPQAQQDVFAREYESMRAHPVVRMIIQVCDELAPYKHCLTNIDALDGSFLEVMPGVRFAPFAEFDVKDAYLQATYAHAMARAREIILLMLHRFYTYGYQLYTEYTSPDMNVDQMTRVVRDALVGLRQVPELSRCQMAFDIIERSLSMLEDNFGTYYTDFLQSRSPTTIFENFVLDVAQGAQVKRKSALVASQFSRIMKYYHSMAQNSGQTAQTKMLFERFTQYNAQLGVRNLGGASASASADASADASASASADASPK